MILDALWLVVVNYDALAEKGVYEDFNKFHKLSENKYTIQESVYNYPNKEFWFSSMDCIACYG